VLYKIVFGHTITHSDFFEFRLRILINYLSVVAVMQPGVCVFFSERVINVRNNLSRDITNFSSVKALKRSLGAIDLSGFCTGSF